MTGTERASADLPTTWPARTAFWWLALSALAIAVFAPLPYLLNSLTALSGGQPVAANYAARPPGLQLAFYLHIGCGGLALLLSPVQFVRRVRTRRPHLHRAVGRVTLACIAVAGTAGLVLAPHSLAGAVGTAGFGSLALLWVVCAARAFQAIRRRDVARHRRWAVRTFALTYAAVTLRLWLAVLIAGQVVLTGVDGDVAFDRAYLVVPFLAWVPNLLVAQWYLARTELRSAGSARPSLDAAVR